MEVDYLASGEASIVSFPFKGKVGTGWPGAMGMGLSRLTKPIPTLILPLKGRRVLRTKFDEFLNRHHATIHR